MPVMLRKIAQRLGILQHTFAGGVHPAMHKVTATKPIEDVALAPLYIVPMKQHIGEVCSPLVSVGDQVLHGQKLAKSEGYLSVPVHAPTSGRVVKIEEHAIPHPSGMGLPCLFIESDGDDRLDESFEPMPDWRDISPVKLRERARICGLAGLGGAVFPTFIKLVQDERFPVETVILNGVECEPWLSNDHRLMVEMPDEILSGLAIIMHMVGAASGIIAIEDNKPDAIAAMREAVARTSDMEGVRVVVLPTRYPQGGEKQLIYTLTGKEVPAGRLPMHIGVLCQNVGTSKALHDAVVLGRPLTERLITVSGDACSNPGNLRVRLGMPVRSLFASRGIDDLGDIHVLHGGPMMGERLKSVDVPVIKSTTALLAMRSETMMQAHTLEQPCIRCSHCAEACPVHLAPNLLADACRSDQFDKAESLEIFDCIECGCCSYVCPANIPLVHYFRYGKGQIAQLRREQQFAEASRRRSEARDARIAREKAERAARRSRVRSEKSPAKTAKPKGVEESDEGKQ